MSKLTWAQKLNNRLRKNWNIEIDFSKCFVANACGKRSQFGYSNALQMSDERIRRLYNELLSANTSDHISIEYMSVYDWEDNWMKKMEQETEYYGFYNSFVIVSVYTPKNKLKLQIDSRHV